MPSEIFLITFITKFEVLAFYCFLLAHLVDPQGIKVMVEGGEGVVDAIGGRGWGIQDGFLTYSLTTMCFSISLRGLQSSSWVLHHDLCSNLLHETIDETFFKIRVNRSIYVDWKIINGLYNVFYYTCLTQLGQTSQTMSISFDEPHDCHMFLIHFICIYARIVAQVA
jgi:hypothetical protein